MLEDQGRWCLLVEEQSPGSPPVDLPTMKQTKNILARA